MASLNASDIPWEVVSGVAIGSLNAALLSTYAIGEEEAMAKELEAAWLNASSYSIYKNWPGGIVEGLFFESGLYNNAPLRDTLHELYKDRTIKRHLEIGATNLLNASFTTFEENWPTDVLLDALVASTALPMLLPPKDMLDSTWFEGSAVWAVDVASAINRCAEKVPLKNIIVDAVISAQINLVDVNAEDYKTLQMLMRYLEIANFYGSMDNLQRSMHAFPDVTFRYVISPTKKLPSTKSPLKFKEKKIREMIEIGY